MISSENIYMSILEHLTEGIYYVDKERKITYWNKAAEKITGYSRDDVLGKSCADNILKHVDTDGNELCSASCPLSDAVSKTQTKEKAIYLHHKDGHRVHIFTRVAPIVNSLGNVIGAVEMFTDLSKNDHGELICELERLKEEVYTDALTAIGNRKYAELNLERRIAEYEEIGIPFTVLFIDIDNFKIINDTYGHIMGDKILKMVAKSMTTTLRSMDIACRWGGEEFVVISPNLTEQTALVVAERIRVFIEKSWIETNIATQLSVTVSIGCTNVKDGDTARSIIHRADKAMYQSKIDGKNTVTFT